jgi:acylphosphatase
MDAGGNGYHTWQLHITGRVQGVGYRYHTQQWAQGLGVTGWVRNEPDGSVRAVIQHEDELVLSKLLARLREGPRMAFVADVQVFDLAAASPERFAAFTVGR